MVQKATNLTDAEILIREIIDSETERQAIIDRERKLQEEAQKAEQERIRQAEQKREQELEAIRSALESADQRVEATNRKLGKLSEKIETLDGHVAALQKAHRSPKSIAENETAPSTAGTSKSGSRVFLIATALAALLFTAIANYFSMTKAANSVKTATALRAELLDKFAQHTNRQGQSEKRVEMAEKRIDRLGQELGILKDQTASNSGESTRSSTNKEALKKNKEVRSERQNTVRGKDSRNTRENSFWSRGVSDDPLGN